MFQILPASQNRSTIMKIERKKSGVGYIIQIRNKCFLT